MHCPILSIFRSDLIRHQRKALKVSGIHFNDTSSEDRHVFFCLFKSSLMLHLMSLSAVSIILLASSTLSDVLSNYHLSLMISPSIFLKHTTYFQLLSSAKKTYFPCNFRSSLESCTSNNTTQHETIQVQHETTHVQHEATRVQNNLNFVLIYSYHRSMLET